MHCSQGELYTCSIHVASQLFISEDSKEEWELISMKIISKLRLQLLNILRPVRRHKIFKRLYYFNNVCKEFYK